MVLHVKGLKRFRFVSSDLLHRQTCTVRDHVNMIDLDLQLYKTLHKPARIHTALILQKNCEIFQNPNKGHHKIVNRLLNNIHPFTLLLSAALKSDIWQNEDTRVSS